jgi:hypothetical protein
MCVQWRIYRGRSRGFCKYCLVFAKYGGVRNQKLGKLIVEPFMNFKDALKVNI